MKSLDPDEMEFLLHSWDFLARDNQLPPAEWGKEGCYIWNLRCGRGYGKTRTAGETFKGKIQIGGYKYTSLCGATAEEVRDIMVNGESGLMNCGDIHFKPIYKPAIKKLFWPNGAITSIFYGTEPEKSRGAQSDLVWMDEIHKWRYPEVTFDNLIFGLRLGQNPLAIVTSTPKPTSFTRELENKKTEDGKPAIITTTGSTFENKDNLSPVFFSAIISKYKGTRLGLQELEAEILDDNPNALFKREIIRRDKVDKLPSNSFIYRIVVGVDPAASSNQKTSNHTGIIVVIEGGAPDALASGHEVLSKNKKHYYVIEDSSIIGKPAEWGARVRLMETRYIPGTILVENNQGGEMASSVIRTAGVKTKIQPVRAVADKELRAMPVSQISEQGRIHFLTKSTYWNNIEGNNLDVLEAELCEWIPGEDSPDRMDAFVHAINYLEGEETPGGLIRLGVAGI